MNRSKPKFSADALKILKDRYLWKDETPAKMLHRIANAVAAVEETEFLREEWAYDFYKIMVNNLFLPNSPTLMNAGRPAPHNQLAACFVIGIEDSMDSICEALRKQMLIHKSGGGTGFNFSNLRPMGSNVNSTNGCASGPVSFMSLFDKATETVQQGGMRRGANMGILNVDHPDIRHFIHCKDGDNDITNFNISVAITDEFMDTAVNEDGEERELLKEIAESAWKSGDPGIIFIDAINEGNTTPQLGRITSTNPCGESPLYPNEACNLGSINLSEMTIDIFGNGHQEFDYALLGLTVNTAVRFLDDIIDAGHYPLPEVEEAVKRTRKIGLGVMGWADLLFKLGIPYESDKAYTLANEIMRTIHKHAVFESTEIGKEKGIPEANKHLNRRNATLTCIAPTGTLSLLAGCSSGIEPLFALEHTRVRTQIDGQKVIMTQRNKYYEEALKNNMPKEDIKSIFVTAHDVSIEGHVHTQAVFQRHTDLAVSKTINMKHDCTAQDVMDAYILAWKERCKGITVYRDGSKTSQVLYRKEDTHKAEWDKTKAEIEEPKKNFRIIRRNG